MRRVTGFITELSDDEVFVFGSNLSGFHGKGAAKTAMKWGAVWGRGEGLYGKTYALPTVRKKLRGTLPLQSIEKYVKNFLECAEAHPDKKFYVTEVGCGLAGLKVKDIAPMFREALAMKNIWLPEKFIKTLEETHG